MQIVLGLPKPLAFSSLPRLCLVQAGIQRAHTQKGMSKVRIRLPITPTILGRIQPQANSFDMIMVWAAATLCFFGFFRAGVITVPSRTAFDPSKHLAWGDIAIDNSAAPHIIKVKLRVSKTDQLGKGVDIFLGSTGNILCPVAAMLAYMVVRGNMDGPFFRFSDGKSLQNPSSQTSFGKP